MLFATCFRDDNLRGGFFGDDASKNATIFEQDGIAGVLWIHFAVRVKNGFELLLRTLVGKLLEGWPDIVTHIAEAMALGAHSAKD